MEGSQLDVFEAIYSLRAMRRLKPDPVPDELIWKVLDAAIRAPSGGNRQPWRFLVVRDQEKKRKIAAWYLEAWNATYGQGREAALADPAGARVFHSADHLANRLAEVPVFIIPVIRASGVAAVSGAGANIFPAVQNLMLAARALGLGTTLTTLHRMHEADVRELLGVPDGYETMCLIPLGWPEGKFGPGARRPVEEVTFWDSWGATLTPPGTGSA
jgi:nitroreductase